MKSAAVSPSTSTAPDLSGLADNQRITVKAIIDQLAAGQRNLQVWGLSATGKSHMTAALATLPEVIILEDWAKPGVDKGKVSIQFKSGLHSGIFRNELPPGIILHHGFSARDLNTAASDKELKHVLRLRDIPEQRVFTEQLAELGLGSTRLLAQLVKLPKSCSPGEEIARFFAEACNAAENTAYLATFRAMTDAKLLTSGSDQLRQSIIIELEKLEGTGLRSLLFGSRGLTDRQVYSIQELIDPAYPRNSLTQSTVDYYLQLDQHLGRVNEPCFVIRSEGIPKRQELVELLRSLKTIQPAIDLRSFEVSDYGTRPPCLHGESGRKTGLFLLKSDDLRVSNGQAFIDEESDLIPLISEHDHSRVRFGHLYMKNGKCLPAGTLIFGGGDHYLSPDHVGMSLAVELILQKLKLPYEVCRGNLQQAHCYFRFDGENIQAGKDLWLMR